MPSEADSVQYLHLHASHPHDIIFEDDGHRVSASWGKRDRVNKMSVSNWEMGPARRQPSFRALGAGVRKFCLKVQRPESYSEPNTSHSHSLLQPHDVSTNFYGPSVAYLWAAHLNLNRVIIKISVNVINQGSIEFFSARHKILFYLQ